MLCMGDSEKRRAENGGLRLCLLKTVYSTLQTESGKIKGCDDARC